MQAMHKYYAPLTEAEKELAVDDSPVVLERVCRADEVPDGTWVISLEASELEPRIFGLTGSSVLSGNASSQTSETRVIDPR